MVGSYWSPDYKIGATNDGQTGKSVDGEVEGAKIRMERRKAGGLDVEENVRKRKWIGVERDDDRRKDKGMIG